MVVHAGEETLAHLVLCEECLEKFQVVLQRRVELRQLAPTGKVWEAPQLRREIREIIRLAKSHAIARDIKNGIGVKP